MNIHFSYHWDGIRQNGWGDGIIDVEPPPRGDKEAQGEWLRAVKKRFADDLCTGSEDWPPIQGPVSIIIIAWNEMP